MYVLFFILYIYTVLDFTKSSLGASKRSVQLHYINKYLNYCNCSYFYLIDFILATDGHLPLRISKEKSSFYNILPVRFAIIILYLPIILICWVSLLIFKKIFFLIEINSEISRMVRSSSWIGENNLFCAICLIEWCSGNNGWALNLSSIIY